MPTKQQKNRIRPATTNLPISLKRDLERIGTERRWSLSQVMRVAIEEFVARERKRSAA